MLDLLTESKSAMVGACRQSGLCHGPAHQVLDLTHLERLGQYVVGATDLGNVQIFHVPGSSAAGHGDDLWTRLALPKFQDGFHDIQSPEIEVRCTPRCGRS